MNPTYDEVSSAFASWRAQHKRDAFRPGGWGSVKRKAAVQFGGRPHMQDNELWPNCWDCDLPLQLLLQLDLSRLPQGTFPIGKGLLQFFYCIAEEYGGIPKCNPWEHFSNGHMLRIIDIDLPDATEASAPEPVAVFAEKLATGWTCVPDYPSAQEYENLGLRVEHTFEPNGGSTQVHWDEGNVHIGWDSNVSRNSKPDPVSHALEGDKISGWPLWVQGVEYPACRICASEMTLLMQLDSEDNLPYMFGDCGCGHITFCKRHPHELAFGWACC